MISMILPYWDRQEAADVAFKLLDQHYRDLDMEIIVVDDGNAVPFRVPETGLNVRVITLPRKDIPLSPVTPWNVGAAAAKGDVLVLSCIEILHDKPILRELCADVDDNTYVLASAWCPEDKKWHCHSSIHAPGTPQGTGFSFCSAISKKRYLEVGGFDEAFRDGAGYEDRDFVNRLHAAGVKFVIRDDLVVTHPKTGARITWGDDKFERNKALFNKKWPAPLVNICCVNWGNYAGRGAEYVNILFDMVRRNLPDTFRFKFICFTNDETGLDPAIEVRYLPRDVTGWLNKLYLFKHSVFKTGERVAFLDLDTVILGPLDNILSYDGEFATLRDFWRHDGLGPAVMLWQGGFGCDLWQKYLLAGYPVIERGDQGWMEDVFSKKGYKPDILQDLYPDQIVSFKTHCQPYPPMEANIVCFHGEPRPHGAQTQWVKNAWKIGGQRTLRVSAECNVSDKGLFANVDINAKRPILWIRESPAHKGVAVICGSGPSLLDHIPELRERQAAGQRIFALNNACYLLNVNGIVPNYQVILDARECNKQFIADSKVLLLASQCHPSLFETDRQVFGWHGYMEGLADRVYGNVALIGGGLTVGLASMCLAHAMGFRELHLFGYDSCHRETRAHALHQPVNDGDEIVKVYCGGREFTASVMMAIQSQVWPQVAQNLANLETDIYVHGDGLIPAIAHEMQHLSKELENGGAITCNG